MVSLAFPPPPPAKILPHTIFSYNFRFQHFHVEGALRSPVWSRQSVDLEVGPTGPWLAQPDPWSGIGEPHPDIPVFLTSQSDLKVELQLGSKVGSI